VLDDVRMRIRSSELPDWLPGAVGGVLFGAAAVAFIKYDGAGWIEAVGWGLAVGVFSGVMMGRFSARWIRTMDTATADLSPDQASLAHHAAFEGPVPDDPRIRSAALDIVIAHQATEPRGRSRVFLLVMAPVIAVWSVYGAITSSPWNLIFLPVPVSMAYSVWITPRRTQRRIDLLSQPDS
jgi:hypothetical protein